MLYCIALRGSGSERATLFISSAAAAADAFIPSFAGTTAADVLCLHTGCKFSFTRTVNYLRHGRGEKDKKKSRWIYFQRLLRTLPRTRMHFVCGACIREREWLTLLWNFNAFPCWESSSPWPPFFRPYFVLRQSNEQWHCNKWITLLFGSGWMEKKMSFSALWLFPGFISHLHLFISVIFCAEARALGYVWL